MFSAVAFYQNEVITSSIVIPNYRADAWTYDQTQSQNSVPNGGFIYPRQYFGASFSITGVGTWNNGLTYSNLVLAGIPLKNSGSSLVGVNRFFNGVPYAAGSVGGQNPGVYMECSEDTLSNAVEIQAITMHATQNDNIKAIYYTGSQMYTNSTFNVSFTNPFNTASYSVILGYNRGLPNNTSALNGFYISSKTTSGFTINRGNMTNASVHSGIIAVKQGMDNAWIKNGFLTPTATATSITFTTAFSDANYAIFITFEGNITPGGTYIYGHTSQTASGFTLQLSSSMWVPLTWTAVKLNYTDYPDGITL